MLGFETSKEKIKEPFSSELRNKLIRFRKGQFNIDELNQFKRSKEILKEYNAIWK